jgi:hypothetical protein
VVALCYKLVQTELRQFARERKINLKAYGL